MYDASYFVKDYADNMLRIINGSAVWVPGNSGVSLSFLVIFEWRVASQELVAQHAQGPYIDCFIVSLRFGDFWGQVI